MDLPEEIGERFRECGPVGGGRRVKRLTPATRSESARYAATIGWIRHRFGDASFERLSRSSVCTNYSKLLKAGWHMPGYNALMRRVVSFADVCRLARIDS